MSDVAGKEMHPHLRFYFAIFNVTFTYHFSIERIKAVNKENMLSEIEAIDFFWRDTISVVNY